MIHPGPRAVDRAQAVCTELRPLSGTLRAGQTVMQAVAAFFASGNCKGGVVRLNGLICDPLCYVLPALSTDGLHAAWYSEPQVMRGQVRIHSATAIVGRKDDTTFLHCHGIWQLVGSQAMGHLLPSETVLAADAQIDGWGASDGWFESLPDAETAFTLFTPAGADIGHDVLARIAPGEDIVDATEALAQRLDIGDARLFAVGSIDHITFADGRRVDCLATELHFVNSRIDNGTASIEIEVVDIHGAIARGELARGVNPVGVTLELVMVTDRERV